MSGYPVPPGIPFDENIMSSGASAPPGPPPGPPPPLPTGTLSLFSMDMDRSNDSQQYLATIDNRSANLELPLATFNSVTLPNSLNSDNQSYSNNGTPCVATGALLSEFEQQAFSEFLNQLSSSDDFAMLMDTSWFSSGPFATAQTNAASSSTTTTDHQTNSTSATTKSKSSIDNYSITSTTPNDASMSMQPLSYTATSSSSASSSSTSTSTTSTSTNPIQMDLPISSALTMPSSTTDSNSDIVGLANQHLPSASWSSAFMNSASTQEIPNQTAKQPLLTHQPSITSSTNNNPMVTTDNSLSFNSNTTTEATTAVAVATAGDVTTPNTKNARLKASTTTTTTTTTTTITNGGGGIRKYKRTNNTRPTSPKSLASSSSAATTTPKKTTNTNVTSTSGSSPSITRSGATLGRPKKPQHELLSESEKKANHIASEQKRRQNIRVGFASLTSMVPTLSQCSRSEALILQKSVEYIRQLVQRRRDMAARIHELRGQLGEPSIELPGDNEDFMRNMGFSGISGDIENVNTNSNHSSSPITSDVAIHAIPNTSGGHHPAIAIAASTASPSSTSSLSLSSSSVTTASIS